MSSKHYTFTPLLYQINKKNKINLKHKKTTINTGESQLFLRIASKHSWCKPLKTGLECSILSLLIRSESNRVPIWLVIEKVWNNRVDVNQNTVSLYVSYLNRKLLALQSKVYIEIDEENIELCVNI